MEKELSQAERLDYLVEAFKKDEEEYRGLKVPADIQGKRYILRSLMNVRMPHEMAEETIQIQDEYLKERIKENGIVTLSEIPTLKERGSQKPCTDHLSIWQGDITKLKVDAIVNAANSQMLGCFIPMHTCIDNCIHTFAGIQLRQECDRKMKQKRILYGEDYEQPTGIPLLTDGYNLPAKKVIHVVGPIVYHGLTSLLEEELAACYRNVLDLCAQNDIKSVAFCCISTGVFHFPNRRATQIAVRTVTDWLSSHPNVMERVIFNVFKDEDKEYYEEELL